MGWLAALAAAFSALVYVNALDNPFVYDDFRTVLNNPSIEDVWAVGAIVYREMTRPVVNFSYALDRAISGGSLLGYHLTNVLLHVLNVLLLFHIARRTVEDQHARMSVLPGRQPVRATVVAFTAAATFGLHPMMTEAVGYISGRSEVLCGVFFLAALLAARRWLLGAGRRWLVLAFGLWIGSLLSKEIGAIWPLVLLGYDRLVLAGDPEQSRRRWRRVLGPLLGLTVLAGLVRVAVLVLVENPGGAEIIWRYALVEVEVMFRYFSLLLSPADQSIFHQVSEVSWPPAPRMILALIWLGAWLGTAWRLSRLDGAITLGMVWFVLLLVPSSVLVLLNLGEPMAEHRVYLAAAGFFLASGTLVGHVWAFFDTRTPRSRLLLRFCLAAWLTVLGGLTVLRNEVWSDPMRLWLDAADKAPGIWLPHMMLGAALQERGAREEAIAAYRRAIHLRRTEQAPYMRLGLAQAELGRLAEARSTFQALLSLDPTSAVGHNGLGAVAVLEHKPDEARRHYENALAHHPDDLAARQSLAMLYETVWQNPAEALRLCDQVRRMAPRTPDIDACIERNRARLPDSPSR
ncbi:MAG: tetratricopeptide repeat protein [Vicinamibacteria bacterium]|nr:tetratricopeptide repeat protein [Vicinamibacteria bacterium]